MYFGYGIVKTQEDFGVQGEPPVHPELLDWLATEFVRTGWDVRAMQRLIVTSATYRQSSKVTPALLEKDPENRLLARGPRLRLPAEMIRDTALAVERAAERRDRRAERLPYQPKGSGKRWRSATASRRSRTCRATGPDLYRRSMYTFWKRTVPPASLATFDAPDREKCTARRALTNTPLQALVLLNDPTYVEAARALAQRALLEGGTDDDDADRVRLPARHRAPADAAGDRGAARPARRPARGAIASDRPGAPKLLARRRIAARRDGSTPRNWRPGRRWRASIFNLDETITKQ